MSEAESEKALRIMTDLAAAEGKVQRQNEWIKSAMADYHQIADALKARGIEEYEDTVTALLDLVPWPGATVTRSQNVTVAPADPPATAGSATDE